MGTKILRLLKKFLLTKILDLIYYKYINICIYLFFIIIVLSQHSWVSLSQPTPRPSCKGIFEGSFCNF